MKINAFGWALILCIVGCASKAVSEPGSYSSNQTNCMKCDVQVLAKANSDEAYNLATIESIICVADSSCKENVEFMELSNEVLFESISTNPRVFIKVFKQATEAEREFILNQFENPVSDQIDLTALLENLDKLPLEGAEVMRASLRVAQAKS